MLAGLLVAWLALGALGASPARATLPPGFQDEEVFENLEEPTTFRFTPDGRVFVAEKPGKILVFENLEDPTPTVFADLRTDVYDTGDRGILGMALDPHFGPEHPYVYVLYTYDHILGEAAPAPKWGQPNHTGDACEEPNGADACQVSGRLVRLTAEGDHAAKETVGAEEVPAQKVLVEGWCQQFSSHSIGDLQFGPEGALYASGGEGASFESADYGQFGSPVKNPCGDPPAGKGGTEVTPTSKGGSLRAQNTENLDGSVIRIDPATGEGMPENPMATSLDANQRRIVGYGFRNPFRFAIDPETDEVYVGNVGWGTYEEIDRLAGVPSPPYNSGWPCYEGPEENPGYSGLGLEVCEHLYGTPGSTATPFFYYDHAKGVTPEDPCTTAFGSAIAGLDFYEGERLPSAYKGALFFSDPIRQCIYVMFPGAAGRPDPATTVPFLTSGGVYAGVDIQEGPEGNLYYAKLFDEEFNPGSGSIHRVLYSSGNHPPIARLKVDHEWSEGDLTALFDATESSDADGEALGYEWDPQGDGTYEAPTAVGTKTLTFTGLANHTVAVKVRDTHGATSVDRITVYPHDTPPKPEILSPEESGSEPGKAKPQWHVGEQIHFEGAAEDAQDGTLPPTSLDWSSHLYHCPSTSCHVHPLQAFPAVASGTLTAPAHDLPSHIELILTATDSRGLTATKKIDLYPREVGLTIGSNPAGLTLTAGLLTQPAPFELRAIEDAQITLSAPSTAQLGGTTYAFSGWSDGGARVHTILANASASYTADYAGPRGGSSGGGGATPSLKAPNTVLRIHPARQSHRSTARFTFSSTQADSTFRCKLDSKPFQACRSPRVYKHLLPGNHVLRVKAVGRDGATDASSVIFRWTVLR